MCFFCIIKFCHVQQAASSNLYEIKFLYSQSKNKATMEITDQQYDIVNELDPIPKYHHIPKYITTIVNWLTDCTYDYTYGLTQTCVKFVTYE